jgi:Ser/Thr protein kinase RdoA (MazF antagonist)
MDEVICEQVSGHPYEGLLPEVILDAIDACGRLASGSLFPLNSYENRVYQVGLEEGGFLIAKFYRPERLDDQAIREEHAFCRELAEQEIPVVAPWADDGGETLFRHQGFRFALYPRVGGRFPDLEDMDLLFRLGRLLGRIHLVGEGEGFRHRGSIDVTAMGRESSRYLLASGLLPSEHREKYATLCEAILERVERRFAEQARPEAIRLHGDFHPGNILQLEQQLRIVDTDDCRNGPAVQDLWMLLSGDRGQMRSQLAEIIEGYEEFREFDRRQLALIEPLRALRVIHYAAWLARRWSDPAFPMHFPWFNSGGYWDEQIHTLQGLYNQLAEEPIEL